MPDIGQMKIEGLFLDHDGTISPLNVQRQESRVPTETEALLHRIRQLIPVGIITTKDMAFIVPRTPFASAWCAIGGLEIRIGERIATDPCVNAGLPYISLALQYVQRYGDNRLFIEEKQDPTRQTIAFCVDWRQSQAPREAEARANEVMAFCQRLPLHVTRYEGQPFFDVYPCPIDKGRALIELKRNLGVKSGVMYMGDSKVDNPAFEVADIGIGVLHEESAGGLACNYCVKFEDVARFFQHLLENNLVFDRDFPEITPRKQR
jgi:trehalose-6-phosphatase